MRHASFVRISIMLGLATLALAACGSSEPAELAGYEQTPKSVGAIMMPMANSQETSFAFTAEPGELLMVNFGYSSCPDICPTTLADTRMAFSQLGSRASDVDFAFVSIDPERDTAEVLTNYVQAFVADGIALRTDDPDELAVAADAFGVSYFVGESASGELEVAHTPNIFLVDETGSIILTWPFGVQPAELVSDLEVVLDRYR